MVEIADVRSAIDTQLATIAGLRHSKYPPDQVNTPIAYVTTATEVLHDDFSDGSKITADVVLLLAELSNGLARGYAALEPYMAKTGSKSIKAALEADGSLTVTQWDDGPIEYNGVVYVGGTWQVEALS